MDDPDILSVAEYNSGMLAAFPNFNEMFRRLREDATHHPLAPFYNRFDSNADPDFIDFPVPGNDDSLRAIELYCDLAARAVLEGLQAEQNARGKDKTSTPTVADMATPAAANQATVTATAATA